MFYPKDGMERYNEIVNDVLDGCSEDGIVISPDNEEEWAILWGFYDEARDPRFWGSVPRDDKVPITEHAINIRGKSLEDENLDVGWCDLWWYHEDEEYRDADYYKFSELFSKEIPEPISPSCIDEMF